MCKLQIGVRRYSPLAPLLFALVAAELGLKWVNYTFVLAHALFPQPLRPPPILYV